MLTRKQKQPETTGERPLKTSVRKKLQIPGVCMVKIVRKYAHSWTNVTRMKSNQRRKSWQISKNYLGV